MDSLRASWCLCDTNEFMARHTLVKLYFSAIWISIWLQCGQLHFLPPLKPGNGYEFRFQTFFFFFLRHTVTVQSQRVSCIACENEGQMGQNDFTGKINSTRQCSTLVQYLSPRQPRLGCSTQQQSLPSLLISTDMCSVCVWMRVSKCVAAE